MSQTTYYKKTDIMLNRAKEYYENNKVIVRASKK